MQYLPGTELYHWLSLITIMALGQFSPGPDMVLVTRNSLAEGVRAGLSTATGIACGLAFQAAIAVAGIATLISQHPVFGKTFTLLAAIYLLWLGFRIFKTAGKSSIDESGQTGAKSYRNSFFQGFWCNILNPSVIIFLAAVTSPFLQGYSGWQRPLMLWLVIVLQGWLLWMVWAYVLQQKSIRQFYRRIAVWCDRLFALALWLLAISLLIFPTNPSKHSMIYIQQSPVPIDWKTPTIFRYPCDTDWFGEKITPAPRYSLVEDPDFLWFIASHSAAANPYPNAKVGQFQENLWQYDVAELFIGSTKHDAYLEINLSPSGAWWSCIFDDVLKRRNKADLPLKGVKTYAETDPSGKGWIAAIALPLDVLREHLDYGEDSTVNVTFILNFPDQKFLSVYPLPGKKPNFHQPQAFPIPDRSRPTAP